MPGWALIGGGTPTPSSPAEWFAKRFANARAAVPAANFDTVIGSDMGNTIEVELIDVVGTASADPWDNESAGVLLSSVGDNVATASFGRVEPTMAPTHVKDMTLRSWYAASLVKILGPLD